MTLHQQIFIFLSQGSVGDLGLASAYTLGPDLLCVPPCSSWMGYVTLMVDGKGAKFQAKY